MVLLRSLVVWTVIILAESIHGTARALFLQPYVGDLQARQIGVITGSVIIFVIVFALIRWVGARTVSQLLRIGCLWVVLTLAFEIGLGRLVMGYSWERIISDYNIVQGGLLSIGMVVLLFAPVVSAKMRGLI
jgi:hypothetical protein